MIITNDDVLCLHPLDHHPVKKICSAHVHERLVKAAHRNNIRSCRFK